MYNDGALESVGDQIFYYPAAANYGYICTGMQSPINLEDHHMIFGMDGQEAQYAGVQTDFSHYVHYQPSHAYEPYLFNPYNPYIPGAVVALDGSLIGMPQFYTHPYYENAAYYENPASAPTYYPVALLSGPDNFSNTITDPFLYSGALNVDTSDERGLRNTLSSASTAILTNSKPASSQSLSSAKASVDPKVNSGTSKLSSGRGNISSGNFSTRTSPKALQGRGSQLADTISPGKAFTRDHGQTTTGKIRPKLQYRKLDHSDVITSPEALNKQNISPGANTTKNHLSLEDYATGGGVSDADQSNLIITESYKKTDSSLDYVNAKFYVIKSFTEDDVHKSVKYNVWSSTPTGNKKLQRAYEDAQKIAGENRGSCPIMLFFSVNGSGLFCGVAEMIGPVDFHKDMDFWHQDRWNGSFPVKWHMIKDVPNLSLRHIILENNEYKPVTHSRDTQEIRYDHGIEMLNLFKKYEAKTSLLDDFMYYENREKTMQKERARVLMKRSPFFKPAINPSQDHHVSFPDIGSLTINPEQTEKNILGDVNTEAVNTVKSADVVPEVPLPASVDSCADSPDILRFGTVHLDPKGLQIFNEAGVLLLKRRKADE